MKEKEHIGIKINKAISYVLGVISVSLFLVAAYYFIKAAFE